MLSRGESATSALARNSFGSFRWHGVSGDPAPPPRDSNPAIALLGRLYSEFVQVGSLAYSPRDNISMIKSWKGEGECQQLLLDVLQRGSISHSSGPVLYSALNRHDN